MVEQQMWAHGGLGTAATTTGGGCGGGSYAIVVVLDTSPGVEPTSIAWCGAQLVIRITIVVLRKTTREHVWLVCETGRSRWHAVAVPAIGGECHRVVGYGGIGVRERSIQPVRRCNGREVGAVQH